MVRPSPPPLKTWESEGSCDLNSIISLESVKMLHGKYLCDVGISGWLCWAKLKVDLAVPKPGGSCWGKDQKRTEPEGSTALLMSPRNPSSEQHKFPHPAGWLLFCSVCKASCVAGDRSPCTVPQFPHLGRGVDTGLLLLWSAVETSSVKHFEVL